MGQQQLLLIILGVIVIAIAIAIGMQLFQVGAIEANSRAIQNDLSGIIYETEIYFLKPENLGGGGGSFKGYSLPDRYKYTSNAKYKLQGSDPWQLEPLKIRIRGESLHYPGNGWSVWRDRTVDPPTTKFQPVGDLFE